MGYLQHWFGGMAFECTTFYNWLADFISTEQEKPYFLVVSWQISHTLAAVMCIRGTRSSYPVYEHDLTLVTVEGKIPSA